MKHHVEITPGTERSFGLVFAIVFGLVAGFNWWSVGEISWIWIAGALIMTVIALVVPKLLAIPNRLWFRFGLLLGAIVAPIVMALVYLVAVVPTGFALRLFGKDPLQRKFDKNAETYWIRRSTPVQPMNNQF